MSICHIYNFIFSRYAPSSSSCLDFTSRTWRGCPSRRTLMTLDANWPSRLRRNAIWLQEWKGPNLNRFRLEILRATTQQLNSKTGSRLKLFTRKFDVKSSFEFFGCSLSIRFLISQLKINSSISKLDQKLLFTFMKLLSLQNTLN